MVTQKDNSALFYRILRVLLATIGLISVIVIVRTVTFTSRQPNVKECRPYDTDFIAANDRLKENLKRAITIRTISYDYGRQNTEELARFVEFLKEVFPTVHSSPLVKREVIANYSLLFTVSGTDKHLKPYILAAHMDVVPTEGQQWDYPDFEGLEEDGFIYGRGTIDDKHSLMGILEALEFRLQRGERLKRTLYVALGHDEEISGFHGARAISKVLQSRKVEAEFLLDEGLTVTDGIVPFVVNQKVALIGVAEKGYLTLVATLNTTNTGHSSMPPQHTTIGKLATAISRLEHNPQPSMFGYGPEWPMLEDLAPEMTPVGRVIMSNLWLFQKAVSWFMSLKPSTNAMIRTTTAVTRIQGGFKDNVIPPVATATINHRIHPAQSVKEVYDYDYRVLNEGMDTEDRIELDMVAPIEPSVVSPHDDHSFGFQTITKSVRQVFPDTAVTPGLMIANTDTRHYWPLTKNIYRFAPTVMTSKDLTRFHGCNERISIKNYEQVVNFYYHLMLNADEENLSHLHTHSSEL